MNGNAPEYDSSQPYAEAYNKTLFDNIIPNKVKNYFDRFGILDFLKMIINSVIAFFRSLIPA